LGIIEVFDSDMGLAAGYFAFASKTLTSLILKKNLTFSFLALQIYLWICAVSLYRDLLEQELDANKPTRTTV
jgi:hypothetical protein